MKNSLGIYFGPKIITILESDGKKVLNNIQVPRASVSGPEFEEKVPDELKMVALFKDALRAHKIDSQEASIALSGRDLIIRTFELPALPSEEMGGAVMFEAKKYIPFKVEDLVAAYQIQFDRSSHKNLILFVGIKKEVLSKYLAILSQLDIKINTIEYSMFSILRFLQVTDLGRMSNKGTIGIMSMDFQEENEVNFVVLDNGFPLFSRDITLIGRPDELGQTEKIDLATILEKLKTEIRISLDYYDRKFPTKNIEKTFVIASEDSRADLEALIKEIGLAVRFAETAPFTGRDIAFSMSFLKSYGCSLAKKVKIAPKIDLLAARAKTRTAKEPGVPAPAEKFSLASLADFKLDSRVVIGCILLCMGVFGYGYYQLQPLQQQLNRILNARPQVSAVNPNIPYEDLKGVSTEFKKRLDAMDSLVRKRLYLTDQLQIIPSLLPDGVWLTNFAFTKEENKVSVVLEGEAYLKDGEKEFEAVNIFIAALRANPAFSKYFKDISITSIVREEMEEVPATKFAISCTGFSPN
ncbi:MAG TPA: pilus assembly protein PilM [Patescibacteria group bacterium]|nr:pilus assembly protein PilM [Patescibacteria group bacterium]